MMRTLTTWLIVTVAGMALVAGCGGKSTTTSSSQPATSSSGSTGTGAVVPPKVNGAQVVSSCKHAIKSQTSISASAKSKLEHICEKASGGSKQALETVAHEECVALVDATPLPNEADRQRALSICKTPG